MHNTYVSTKANLAYRSILIVGLVFMDQNKYFQCGYWRIVPQCPLLLMARLLPAGLEETGSGDQPSAIFIYFLGGWSPKSHRRG